LSTVGLALLKSVCCILVLFWDFEPQHFLIINTIIMTIKIIIINKPFKTFPELRGLTVILISELSISLVVKGVFVEL